MAFQFFNPNPYGTYVGDCVIRALCKALDCTWYKIYAELAIEGYIMGDMPSSNRVWGKYLKSSGFKRYVIPNTCPDCYTIKDFCADYPKGTYIVGTGTHVVCVKDGKYYDSWDSGDEVPMFFFKKEA